jgi:hypothetical protein
MRTVARAVSFSKLDHEIASGVLGDFFCECNVYLGGSSFSKGFKKAAHYYLSERVPNIAKLPHLELPGVNDLNPECDQLPLEEAFYVVNLGIVVSQVYQCE